MTVRLAAPKDVGPRRTMNAERAAKIAAKRIGCPVDEYVTRREAGEKWCSGCRRFHPAADFSANSRDCRKAARDRLRRLYTPQVTPVAFRGARGRPPACTYEQVAPLFMDDHSLAEIARKIGCSYWSVRRALLFLGPERSIQRQREKRAAEKRRCVELVQCLSLDAPLSVGGFERHEVVPGGLEPLAEVLKIEMGERLRAVVGDMCEDDVLRMGADDIERLQDRLRAEGLTPRGVQQAERERLRDPQRHAGEFVKASKGHGGKRGRAEQSAITKQHKVRNMTRAQKRADAERRKTRTA